MAYYADRFIKETQQLRPIETAAFYRLFESYAQSGYLLDDLYMLRSIVRLDSELTVIEGMTGTTPDYAVWMQFTDSTINSLLSRFFTLEADGHYHHAGWDKELAKARTSYDARLKGARTVNAKKAAEREAEQHTTYNEQRTTLQPTALQPTADTGELTADSPQGTSDSESEQPTAHTGNPTIHIPHRTSETRTETASAAGSSPLSGMILPIQTAGQRVPERSATGTVAGPAQTAATGSAQSGQFTPEQLDEIHKPKTPERLAAIRKFRIA